MKFYRAETGKQIRLRKSFESLDGLKTELEQVSGVPVSSQILMTNFGTQLKGQMMSDVNNAVGKDDYIFLFNRELLDANNTNIKESLAEKPSVEPPITASTALKVQKRGPSSNINLSDECGAYVNLFQTYHSQGQSFIKAATIHTEFCEQLYQEQKVQLMALRAALTNLDAHSRSVIDAHEVFYTFAEKEIIKHTRLIQNLSVDLETLRRITIHPDILKYGGMITSDKNSYTLADYVTEDKLITLANEGNQIYDQIAKRVQSLTSSIHSVQSGTETLKKKRFDSLFPKMEATFSNIQDSHYKLKQIAEKLERDATRVQSQVSKILESNTSASSTAATKSIEAFEHLANFQSQEYLPEISRLESSIAGIPSLLSGLDTDVRSKAQDFKDLNYVHQMPIAYAMTIVEIVRRKEYAKLILSKAQQMAEIMGHFRNTEQKRRDYYRTEVKKYVPVNIQALDDNPPMCDISTANIKEDKLPSFTTRDVHSFLNFIEEIRPAIMSQASYHRSSTFTASLSKIRIQSPNDDPLANLHTILLRFASQLEGMNHEFDRVIEKSFLSEKNANDKNSNIISRPISLIEGRSLTPQAPIQPGRRSKRSSRQSFSEGSSPSMDANMDLYVEKTKLLEKAEEKLKAYEARIKSLENTLYTNYQAARNSSILSSTAGSDNASMPSTVVSEEISDLRSRYKTLESSYTTEVNEKMNQEKKAKELEIRYKNLESSYNIATNDRETLLKKINELETRCQKYEASHTKVVKEREAVEERTTDLETRYQNMETSYVDAVKIKTSLENKVDELQKQSEALESSHAIVMKEKENELLDLQAKVKKLQNSHDSSTVRCNELIAKVAELEKTNKEPDNIHSEKIEKYETLVKDLKQNYQDLEADYNKLNDEYEKKLDADSKCEKLEKRIDKLIEEKELAIKDKIALDAEKSDSERKINDILSEKNELETRLEEYKQKYEQDRLSLNERIEELEAQQLMQEQIEAVKERWRKKIEELQKEKDNMTQTYELNKQEMLNEIESWKASLDKMNLAREETDKLLEKSRERGKQLERENAETKKALEQHEKLVMNITETIVTYMDVATAYDISDQTKSGTNLNPIFMIQKVGNVANSMARELCDTKQSLETSKATHAALEETKNEMRQMLVERTEISRLLSNCLWDYYNNIRTLMSAMELALPVNNENGSNLTSTEKEKGKNKSSESRLSDSYFAEDLGKFFTNNSEQIEWPKDKYETLLNLSTKVNLNEVRHIIRRTPKDAEDLGKKYKKESKLNREKYIKANQESKEKIAFRNFKNGDLALFLPTRNSSAKPWAAFNINCPHYFLRATDTISGQIRNKDWIVARVVEITEHRVDVKKPGTNPYELPDGVKFYVLDVESWQNNNNSTSSHHSRKRTGSESSTKSSRNMSASLSNLSSARDTFDVNDTNSSMSSSTANMPTTNTRDRIQSLPPPPTHTYSSGILPSDTTNTTNRPMSNYSFKSLFYSLNESGSKDNS
ncbi:3504_t:CDS:10 [Funneliformis geosporum]|uniref:Autophagy-related protein 11 n=1 Tax=Funneliformis geosporum TaxID=1117311 RepID=A0A9W4SBI9_9GLOM|nr:12257_t:CDS:10 [Funneliformis geosporum]CAI2163784.1 3504_t:CDS:10 [Funneliformis geosporum]